MSSRKYVLLLSLVVITIGYAAYDVISEQREEKSKAEVSKLYSGKPDQVQRLEFKSATAAFSLIREDGGWKFETPLTEKADSETVTEFIEGIATEKSTEVLTPTERSTLHGCHG